MSMLAQPRPRELISSTPTSATAQLTASRRSTSATISRCRALSSLLSRSNGWRNLGGSTTAPATSGPAYAPRPTSSMPQRRKARQSLTAKVVEMYWPRRKRGIARRESSPAPLPAPRCALPAEPASRLMTDPAPFVTVQARQAQPGATIASQRPSRATSAPFFTRRTTLVFSATCLLGGLVFQSLLGTDSSGGGTIGLLASVTGGAPPGGGIVAWGRGGALRPR